jgi:hypothetical protein
MEYIMINRKKKRRRINILTNLFDVIRSLISNTDLNMIIVKKKFFICKSFIKRCTIIIGILTRFVTKKIRFYSQLIERYHLILSSKESTYLNLTSSNLNRNHYLKKGSNIKITTHNYIRKSWFNNWQKRKYYNF